MDKLVTEAWRNKLPPSQLLHQRSTDGGGSNRALHSYRRAADERRRGELKASKLDNGALCSRNYITITAIKDAASLLASR